MIKHKEQRVGVFVDVQNLYYSAKNLFQAKVNFGKVLEEAVAGRKLVRAVAYVIKAPNSLEDNFFQALDTMGYEIKSKDLQVYAGGNKKGDWDVGLVIDAIRMSRNLDVVILVSGDGDYVPAVEYLQNNGVMVEAVAFQETTSSKLIDKVDDFTNLSASKRKFLIKY
jgi:uncharacterized LabA/DUF88 family protein